MSWSKLDDSLSDHPKAVAAGVALGLWARCLAWCNRHHTDGSIPARHALTVASCVAADPFCSATPVDLCERLVDVGLWTVTPTGYAIHDFHDYHESRAEYLARCQADLARKRRVREDSGRNPDGQVTESARTPDGIQAESERTPRARVRGPGRPSPSPSPRSETEADAPISSEQSAPTPLALEFAPIPAPKARAEKAPKPEREPLPFRAADALAAVAETAGAAFVLPGEVPITKGLAIAIENVIRRGIGLDAFILVGAWLAAGGRYGRPEGPKWLAGSFGESLEAARRWDAAGRGPTSRTARPTRSPPTLPAYSAASFEGAQDCAGDDWTKGGT